jgi:hypothetical protein
MNNNLSPVEFIVWALNQHLRANKVSGYPGPAGQIVCADGTRFSVQAGEFVYCTPRDNVGPWTHVEVMACTRDVVPQHWEQDDDRIGGYIPIQCVAQEIYERSRVLPATETLNLE